VTSAYTGACRRVQIACRYIRRDDNPLRASTMTADYQEAAGLITSESHGLIGWRCPADTSMKRRR
jgi:hypothetical protein